jgi:hypothetical protein
VDDPLLQVHFETVLLAGALLGCFFALWSVLGLRDAYRSIGRGGISLDVPFTDDSPVDRGGSR